jgi:hypothetical protein
MGQPDRFGEVENYETCQPKNMTDSEVGSLPVDRTRRPKTVL